MKICLRKICLSPKKMKNVCLGQGIVPRFFRGSTFYASAGACDGRLAGQAWPCPTYRISPMGSGMPSPRRRPRWPLRRRATRPRAERSNERAGGGGDARLCGVTAGTGVLRAAGPGAGAGRGLVSVRRLTCELCRVRCASASPCGARSDPALAPGRDAPTGAHALDV
jgi:hypothetical protein